MSRLRDCAASFLYLGKFPFVPGTVGSLGAAALYLLVALALKLQGVCLSVFAGAAGLVFAAVGIAIGRWAQDYYGQRDPRQFVLDEAAGMMISLVTVTPTLWAQPPWRVALAAFLLFRLFDIVKPCPASRAEQLHGGWGIVLDDVIAGIYAAALTHVWFHFVA
jgi:phosphatidylglycerophosphatase A